MDGWGWMWVWPVLIVIGLALLGYAGVKAAQGKRRYPPPGNDPGASARRVLDERFARGEIDEEEYVRRKETLG
ncbi:SHOCT domain-containing protein [Actinocorallia sp. B10E7]|uniref:SHOCT domain-containing protein n=1 Tax=Actinocorallia sp. B10E7 TaxID=3153558 RepID=UPI00325DACA6